MSSLLGMRGRIRIMTFEVTRNELGMNAVHRFLDKYEGNIIDIQTCTMRDGMTKIVIIYNKFDEERRNEA